MRTSPREHASCLSVLLFWWMRKIITLKRELREEDVYPVLQGDHAGIHGNLLEKNWIKHLRKCAEKNTKPSFRWVLFVTYAKKFIFYGIFSMLEECLYRMIQVISLGVLIEYFSPGSSKSHSKTMAYLAAGGVILGSLCFFLSFHWSMFNTHHMCTHIRLGMSSLIYRKTLRLSQATMRSFSVGQLITMLSTDVYRLDMQDLHLNYLWIAPIQLGVVIYLLYYHYEFGLPSLSGLVLLAIFVFFQYIMGIYVKTNRKNKIAATNKRLRIITEILDAFYNIKLYAWENAFFVRAKESRRIELKYVKTTMILRILTASFSLILTKMTVFLTLLLYIYMDQTPLDSRRVFITLILYEHVRINLAHLFTRGAVDFAEVSVTTKRMTEFLLLEEKYADSNLYESYTVNSENMTVDTPSNGIYIKQVQCKWHYDQDNMTLDNISLDIMGGKMLAIVGPTGSGKSSCLAAILGELPIVGGKLTVQGKIAYIPQTPWLFPGTIRQNIIFGREYNHEWYTTVLEMCGLRADFDNMEDGDQTKIVRAVLSVGQKARISLARAVYSNCDIYLMDDPLSCIDVRLQRHILEKCIRGALKNKTVLLVTHQLHFLEAADDIAILLDGKLIAKGTYKELLDLGITFSKEVEGGEDEEELEEEQEEETSLQLNKGKRNSFVAIEQDAVTNKMIVKEHNVPSGEADQTSPTNLPPGGKSAIAIKEIEDNENDATLEPDKIGIRLFWAYLRTSSSWYLIAYAIVLCIAVQALYTGSEIFLEEWTHDEEERADKNEKEGKLSNEDKKERQAQIIIYCVLIPSLVIFSILRSFAMFKICMNSSLTLFCQLLNSLLHAKAKFFESSCAGHGINRFSKDILVIDELLPTTLYEITGVFLEIIGALVILCFTLHWATIPSAIFLVMVCLVYHIYHKNAATLKRLEANARSPIYAHTAKTLEGLSTIRAFEQERIFLKIFEDLQDNHTAAWYLYTSLNTWLSIVVDWLSLLLVAAITMIYVFGEPSHATSSGVGLAIGKVIELSILMQIIVSATADSETEMISVERILDYSQDSTEDDWEKKDNKPPPYWPLHGNIAFEHVSVAGHGDKVLLSDINLEISEGEKVGIVGRSGSGKTTLINTLYRITEPSQGQVFIDDINIKDVGLHDLRKNISIIPQVPYVFTGTLRMNLDPLGDYPDHEIWSVLNEVNLFDTVKTMDAGLDTYFTEAGWQLSPGQAQLLGLARVLLQKNQILCLDHAMNNLDPLSQKLIHKKIKEKFSRCTILTIAHRLQPLMGCNKIMVIESGRVVDFGDPYTLIKQQGPLCSLIMHLGKKNAEEITRLAKESELRRRASKKSNVNFLETMFM